MTKRAQIRKMDIVRAPALRSRSFHYKLLGVLGGTDYGEYLDSIGGGDWLHMQDAAGSSVAQMTNSALATGRNLATLTYAGYVAGANWANSSAQIARHTAGAVETIQQDDLLSAGKTYEYEVVISNRTAGTITVTDGDGAISATATVTITSTGTDLIITPSTDFDGDIDLAQGTVKQTGILASTDPSFTSPGDNPMDATITSATAGQAADGDLGLSVLFDATNDVINQHSAELNSKLNPDTGSLVIWYSNNNWTGTRYLINLLADSNNRINIYQFAGDIFTRHVAGATARQIEIVTAGSGTGWHMAGITWGSTAVIGYHDGVAIGSVGGVGTWVGNLSSTGAAIGSSISSADNIWSGWLTRRGLFNRVLSASEMLEMYEKAKI